MVSTNILYSGNSKSIRLFLCEPITIIFKFRWCYPGFFKYPKDVHTWIGTFDILNIGS